MLFLLSEKKALLAIIPINHVVFYAIGGICPIFAPLFEKPKSTTLTMEEKQSNISTYIGMGLIFLLMYMWMLYSKPPEKVQQTPDQAQTTQTTPDQSTQTAAAPNNPASPAINNDSTLNAQLLMRYGAFATAATGSEQTEVLENELVRITFTSKGARIKEVFLKKYQKVSSDSAHNDIKSPLRLLEDEKNVFGYDMTVQGAISKVNTADLYFTPSKSGNTLSFRADAGQGRYLEQVYTLSADNYQLDYSIGGNGLNSVLTQNQLQLLWVNHLDKLEKNQEYERTMSSVYFKETEGKADYCNCREDATENLGSKPIQWFSHSNQFFNTSIVAQNFQFKEFTGETRMLSNGDPDLKLLKSSAIVPLDNMPARMVIYSGPNEFDRLRAYNNDLQDIIPFGASIFGGINRWVIHPILEMLSMLFSNKGIVILMLTLLVKLLVYPLTYRMVLSQAKMSALKPRLDALRKKFGDDQQAMSMETMKVYSEYKVNPLGGCLPILLQMPVWFALYRFFPAAIEFRQAGFLWATDLSSYDVALVLPFSMPGFGTHISAFTLIWVVTTLWYTWYNMKQMDMSAMQSSEQMKIMKWMQYLMPVMFMFFFNSFASGLTLYLCFSNILNIAQTIVTKRYLIDNDKILAKLEENKNKGPKPGGFRERLEQAMKEQERMKQEKAKKK